MVRAEGVREPADHHDLDRPLPAAVAALRIHHEWMPDRPGIEGSLDDAVIADQRRRGHTIKPAKTIGVLQPIAVSSKRESLAAVRSPPVSVKATGP